MDCGSNCVARALALEMRMERPHCPMDPGQQRGVKMGYGTRACLGTRALLEDLAAHDTCEPKVAHDNRHVRSNEAVLCFH